MKQTIFFCDGCNAQLATVYQRGDMEGDFCRECLHPEEKGCQHEDNISDMANGKSEYRLICKDCGYDRVEAVEEVAV